MLDLCGAFFSIPLSMESQGLFGFTYKGQFYEYKRLPQGFKHSPHIFNKVLKDDLAGIDQVLTSVVIQYVDDIIICSLNKQTCQGSRRVIRRLMKQRRLLQGQIDWEMFFWLLMKWIWRIRLHLKM